MKKVKVLSLLLSILLFGSQSITTVAADSVTTEVKEAEVECEGDTASQGVYTADELLVVYDDAGTSNKQSRAIQKEAEAAIADVKGADVKEEIAEKTEDQGTTVLVDLSKGTDIEAVMDEIESEDSVAHVQPNYVYELLDDVADTYVEDAQVSETAPEAAENDENPSLIGMGVNDPYVVDENSMYYTYYLDRIFLKEAWNAGAKTEKAVSVAVLDTGCRYTHEDLRTNVNMDLAYDVYNEKKLSEETGFSGDKDGHGTHVCGLVAAEADNGKGIAGTSYNAEIIPMKIFDDSGKYSSTEYIVKALNYLEKKMDANELTNLRVINISAGYRSTEKVEKDELLEQKINELRDNYNVLTVCAAGNWGDDMVVYPSDFGACFSVTNVDGAGNAASNTSYNQYKDIAAPGQGISSTGNSGDTSYTIKSGTSMSAPIVSGICALVWSQHPGWTADQVVEAIEKTATPFFAKTGDGSAGIVNAKAAIDYTIPSGRRISLTSEATISEIPAQSYDGTELKPSCEVRVYGKKLIENQDYTVSYANNVNAGEATVTIKGINEYQGAAKRTFTIEPLKIVSSGATFITLEGRSYEYCAEQIKPAVTRYRRAGVLLQEGKDFQVEYENNIDVGIAKVLVKGINNYTGSGSTTFTISVCDITGHSVKLSKDNHTYNNKLKKPNVYVLVGRKYVKLSAVSYSDNKKIGTASVMATASGNCKGTVSATFKINPAGTKITKLTKKSKSFQVKWKKQKIGTKGYQIQYSQKSTFENAKINTVSKTSTTSKTIKKLKKKTKYYVRVRTYSVVKGKKYYSGWSAVKTVIVK